MALKKIGIKELDFSFEQFANFLTDHRTIINLGKRFYVGTVREQIGNPRSKQAMSDQSKLFHNLKINHWEIKTSKLRTRLETIKIDDSVMSHKNILAKGITEISFYRMREKGIDVKLATDLIVGAVDNQYDTAVVVSSDTDLVPAIDWVRHRYHKKIEYIGFSIKNKFPSKEDTKPSPTMIRYTDIQRVLTESDLSHFTQPKLT